MTPEEREKQEEEIEREVLTWFAALVRQQDEVSGTPAYMAPEQMLQSRALITPQTDIYNLAAVLFYLASQRLPVPAATAQVRCVCVCGPCVSLSLLDRKRRRGGGAYASVCTCALPLTCIRLEGYHWVR